MKLSKTSLYALYGLAYLASQPRRRVPLSEIRRRWGMPEKHLGKIFGLLARAGLVRSVRGAKGGFTLSRPARAVSVLEVLRILGEPGLQEDCLLGRSHCPSPAACRLTRAVRRAQECMARVLRAVRLIDLA
jgi:Rrf2 family nitric oxide-sensitive transcriptional repressor